jgi:hypothetical protein
MNGRLSKDLILRFKKKFKNDCLEGILLGYAKMRSDKQYQIDWVEDKFTVHLIAKMHETGFFVDKNIIIIPQAPLYNESVAYGDANPLESPVIDFKFGRIWARNEYNYYAEAKNLSENNWCKTSGASVNAYDSRAYYISDGINRYLTGYYPEGCLIGYVVNGSVSGIVHTINRLLVHRRSIPKIGLIERDKAMTNDCCYISNNHLDDQIYSLTHLLLQLA